MGSFDSLFIIAESHIIQPTQHQAHNLAQQYDAHLRDRDTLIDITD
jgi:hypothetical protein